MGKKVSGAKAARPQSIGLITKRRLLQPDQPPTGVHHVSFSRVGGEVVMDVGYFDMPELVEQLNKARSIATEDVTVEATVKIVAQYSMAADTFLRLQRHVNEIHAAMVESGDIKEPESGKSGEEQ